MIQATFLEQLQTVLKILLSNRYVFYIILIAIGVIFVLELSNILKNKNIVKIISILIYLVVFGTLLFFFHKEIFIFIDYLINNIFLLLFFPNLAVYTIVILIINIILATAIFKDKKSMKHLNILFFVLFNILFYLIIDNVIYNNINVYEQLSIYTNRELLILIELSMELFIIWIVLLGIIKISNRLSFSFIHSRPTSLVLEPNVNEKELESINLLPDKKLSEIPKKTLNVLSNENEFKKEVVPEYVDIKPINVYNDYIDIQPIKKKKNCLLSGMDQLFEEEKMVDKKDMDVIFKDQYIYSIMKDIDKLKYNREDKLQIQKVYEEITLSQNNLTLEDYNALIHKLTEIKNNY